MPTPIEFRPHCALLKISDSTYHLYMRVFLPAGYKLGAVVPTTPTTAIHLYQFSTQGTGGANWPHWEEIISPIVVAKTLPMGADCTTHRVEVEVHNGSIDANPEGKTVIRTIDADDNGG